MGGLVDGKENQNSNSPPGDLVTHVSLSASGKPVGLATVWA